MTPFAYLVASPLYHAFHLEAMSKGILCVESIQPSCSPFPVPYHIPWPSGQGLISRYAVQLQSSIVGIHQPFIKFPCHRTANRSSKSRINRLNEICHVWWQVTQQHFRRGRNACGNMSV
mmetsp:Transcript_1450/g.2661  ORF Transcript_1450/g.2661 Transcript_1450/m.2661 type:complete len:119 (-) Transcript_1450:224-580(-)